MAVGDAVLVKFDAVIDALTAAIAIRKALTIRKEDLSDERKLQFRMGVNLGDVIEDRGDIYGASGNVAARLETLADLGGICVSGAVCSAVGKKVALRYESLGEQQVKNIDAPVRVSQARGLSMTGDVAAATCCATRQPGSPLARHAFSVAPLE